MPIVCRLFFLPFFVFFVFSGQRATRLHMPPPPALHSTVPSLNATRMHHHNNRMSPFFSFFLLFSFFCFHAFSFRFSFLFLFFFLLFLSFFLFSFSFIFLHS